MRSRGFAIWILGLVLLVTAACTASRPPTPTPPPASDGGAAEATPPSTPTPDPSPTETLEPPPTPTRTETPTPNLTATAQAEREQAEKQLWQKIEELKQFFEEGYSYTLEEKYRLDILEAGRLEQGIANLIVQDFQFFQVDGTSLWFRLEELMLLAKQLGYNPRLRVRGKVNVHRLPGEKFPINLEWYDIVVRGSRLDFKSWKVSGEGVDFLRSIGAKGYPTYRFFTNFSGRATGPIYEMRGEGDQELILYLILESDDGETKEIPLGKVEFEYDAYYKQNFSGGFSEELYLLPEKTKVRFEAP